MSPLPRWMVPATAAALLAMLIALAKPSVAHLALQALLVEALVIVVVVALVVVLRDVDPVDPRSPAIEEEQRDLPKELGVLADELRTSASKRSATVPMSICRQLRSSLQHRLWYRHGLSTTVDEHRAAIEQVLSPLAAALVQSAPNFDMPTIALAQLPALIDEVEKL